jgi:TorA maturation chaperone TorD
VEEVALRDQGLDEAIRAVGGVTELARRIGIAQPSISNWDRVPADRVVAVETATGVSRMRLRPDLYGEPRVAPEIDEIESARSQEYALLSALLMRAPDKSFLSRLAKLRGDDSPLGLAHAALGEAAQSATAAKVASEYYDLFVGLGRGELLPYGSYYLTGFLNERPLARLREDLLQLGIERVDGNFEPEDHAGTLCEIMSAIVGGRFPASEEIQRRLFEKHIAPWMGRLFSDMANSETANFYRHVGTVGRTFLDIEMHAFSLRD